MAEGWKSRAERREEARELAKLLMHGASKPKQSRSGATLTCLVTLLGILLIIFPPQSRPVMFAWLVVMFGLGLYPAFHLAQWLPIKKKWIPKVLGVAGLGLIICGLGYWQWPPIRRHMLDKTERSSFENVLKPQKGSDLDVQIGCPADDEKTCIYAGQFVSLLGESEWKIEPWLHA